MKQASLKNLSIPGLVLLLGCLLIFFGFKTGLAHEYESYFLYHGAYPEDQETPYSGEGSNNTQGITHDDNNWFISMTEELWKIPVQYDLGQVNTSDQYPGVIHLLLSDISPLAQAGYFHIGDLSYYKSYVVAPIEANAPQPHAMVLFRASDLQYVGRAELPGYKDLGWVAVDPDGYVYTTGDFTTSINKYAMNWTEIPGKAPSLTFIATVNLLDESGSPLLLGHTQGGVFSESGDLLYMLSGIFDQHDPNEGITVFDTHSWRRVRQSDISDDCMGEGPFFCYHFDPICFPEVPYICEEPEGLTLWDLDDGRAPGISGQLHVVMLDNDGAPDDDDVTIYHYINTLHVDRAYSGNDPSTGEPHKPFKTIGEANYWVWDGARIKIQTGDYAEAVTFSRRIQILAQGGTVRFGTGGRISLTTFAAINLYSGGALRLSAP